jgi:hypothetical protein
MDKVERFSKLLAQVSRIGYSDLAEGEGVADALQRRPAQREWACFVDSPEGPQCVCSIYSVGTKVLTLQPYEFSKMCSVCELLDVYMDDQQQLDNLLSFVLTNADEIEPLTPEDDEVCENASRFICDACHARDQETEVVETPPLLLN